MSKDTKSERLFNDTFNVSSPTWLNACTGENGAQDLDTYAEAFRLAPQILLDKVLDRGSVSPLTDTLVFPIVFCMRHAVELHIKDSIKKLSKIRINHEVDKYIITSSHDIGIIWRFFKDQSLVTDSRYYKLVKDIESYINDIAEIDPTGQVFRYPSDIDDKKHLERTPIVNLLLLRKRFGELEALLDELNLLNNELIEEYSRGTFTDKLSRWDIFNISQCLPDRGKWKESEEFDTSKQKIKMDHNLSNRHFSKAVDIIQDHYEFSQNIGIEIPLKNSTADDYVIYFDCLNEIHPGREESSASGIDLVEIGPAIFEEMERHHKIISSCVKRCLDNISIEALTDIAAIYETGRLHNQYWTEEYLRNYHYLLKDFKSTQERGRQELEMKVQHRLNKTNAKESIILSLNKLGQKGILEVISASTEIDMEV